MGLRSIVDTLQQRLAYCRTRCLYYQRTEDRCGACGCIVQARAAIGCPKDFFKQIKVESNETQSA